MPKDPRAYNTAAIPVAAIGLLSHHRRGGDGAGFAVGHRQLSTAEGERESHGGDASEAGGSSRPPIRATDSGEEARPHWKDGRGMKIARLLWWSSRSSRPRVASITDQRKRWANSTRAGGISRSAKPRSCMVPRSSVTGATRIFRRVTRWRSCSITPLFAAAGTPRT